MWIGFTSAASESTLPYLDAIVDDLIGEIAPRVTCAVACEFCLGSNYSVRYCGLEFMPSSIQVIYHSLPKSTVHVKVIPLILLPA